MGVKCAVNGFGRVGRYLVRAALGYDDLEIVAVNSRAKSSILAHLLKYDSVHGKFPGEVSCTDKALVVNGREIRITNITDNCALLPWKELGVGIVLESTGEFRKKAEVAPHIEAGAKKVIIAAPGKGIDGTFVMGVNEETYDAAKHHIVSNASCTTNCLAPGVQASMEIKDVTDGFIKAIVFVVIVSTVCCYQGYFAHMRTDSHGAKAVGLSTTSAVVLSCVLICVADYVVTSLLI